VGSWHDVRSHPLLALRAIVIGFASLAGMGSAFFALRDVLTGAGFVWHGIWIGLPWYWHWPYSSSLATVLSVWSIGAPMLLGWIIVRLHRAHGLTMLLAFRAAWLVQTAATVLWIAPGLFGLRFIQNFVISSLLMFIGGFLATRRPNARGVSSRSLAGKSSWRRSS